MSEIICKMCGQCCNYFDKNGKLKRCKMLVTLKDTTLCRIYNKRLGLIIDKEAEAKCMKREQSPYDYPDCPYNTDKPKFSWAEVKKLRGKQHGNSTNNRSI